MKTFEEWAQFESAKCERARVCVVTYLPTETPETALKVGRYRFTSTMLDVVATYESAYQYFIKALDQIADELGDSYDRKEAAEAEMSALQSYIDWRKEQGK